MQKHETMNIELKHLAAYLPYGLKFISEIDKPYNEFGAQPKWTLDGITTLFGDCCLTTKENSDAYSIQACKPILRPLSDLAKEIEVNGERFVPIEKIAIYGNNKGYLEEAILTGLVEVIVFNMLISWHFDVFGLIEKGLAIDVNT